MGHTRHLRRAAFLVVLMLIAFAVARHLMIPESFGVEGHYRFDSVRENMAGPVRYGRAGNCGACHEHEDEVKMHVKGRHASVPCEACHAPLAVHARGDKKTADMPVHPSYKMCDRCHLRLAARPKSFSQYELAKHLTEQGVKLRGKIPKRVCKACHHPIIPETKR